MSFIWPWLKTNSFFFHMICWQQETKRLESKLLTMLPIVLFSLLIIWGFLKVFVSWSSVQLLPEKNWNGIFLFASVINSYKFSVVLVRTMSTVLVSSFYFRIFLGVGNFFFYETLTVSDTISLYLTVFCIKICLYAQPDRYQTPLNSFS